MTCFPALVPARSPLSAAHGSEILSPPGFKEPALLSSPSLAAARERKQNAWGGCEQSTGSASQRAAVPGGALKRCPNARVLPSSPAARSGRIPCSPEPDPEHVSPAMGLTSGLHVAACGQPLRPSPRPKPVLRSDNSVSHSFSCAAERRAVWCRGGLACRGQRLEAAGDRGWGCCAAGGAHRARGEPRAEQHVLGRLGWSLPDRVDNHSVGKQVSVLCCGFDAKSRAAGLPAGSCRQGLPAPSSSRAWHSHGHLPGQLQCPCPQALRWAGDSEPGRGKGSWELALLTAGKGHTVLGTLTLAAVSPQPCPWVLLPSAGQHGNSATEALGLTPLPAFVFRGFTGAQQTAPAPAVTRGAGPPAQRWAKGLSRLFALDGSEGL